MTSLRQSQHRANVHVCTLSKELGESSSGIPYCTCSLQKKERFQEAINVSTCYTKSTYNAFNMDSLSS